MPRDNHPNRDLDNLDQICWSCRTSIDQATGISLNRCDGNGSLHVCAECWEEIPITDRIKLQWLFRSKDEEGSGLADAILDFRKISQIASRVLLDHLAHDSEPDVDDLP